MSSQTHADTPPTPAPRIEFSGDATLSLGHVAGWRTFHLTTPPPPGTRLLTCSFRLSGMLLVFDNPGVKFLELRFAINRGQPGAYTAVTHVPFAEGGIELSFNFEAVHPSPGGVCSVDVYFGHVPVLRREIAFPSEPASSF